MKIAVLGRGTAGAMAAVHMTCRLPDAELFQIHDSTIPIIGVGEGTTTSFPRWFTGLTGIDFGTLLDRCGGTVKQGTIFERWGPRATRFLHRFQPSGDVGYHFDARRIVDLLSEHARATAVDARVVGIEREDAGAIVALADGRRLAFDFVLDARGYPDLSDPDVLRMDWMPMNAAMVERVPGEWHRGATLSVARPHGWIFGIPLVGSTSFGYVYDATRSSAAAVDADFDAFLQGRLGCAPGPKPRRVVRFPAFTRRTFSDGVVFRVGNAASFLEPLEAVGIGTVILALHAAGRWIAARGKDGPAAIAAYNDAMFGAVCKSALFISWHYSRGARFDTPFWDNARRAFARAAAHPELAGFAAEFEPFLEVARAFPIAALEGVEDRERWNLEIFPLLRLYRPFGTFSELNVAQVGHGLGLFEGGEGPTSRPLRAAEEGGST